MTVMPDLTANDVAQHPLVEDMPGFAPILTSNSEFPELLANQGATREDAFRLIERRLHDQYGLTVTRDKLELLARAPSPSSYSNAIRRLHAAIHSSTSEISSNIDLGLADKWATITLSVAGLAKDTERYVAATLAEFRERTGSDYWRFKSLNLYRWRRATLELPMRALGAWDWFDCDWERHLLGSFNIWALLDCVRRFEDVSPLAKTVKSFVPHVPDDLRALGNPIAIGTFDTDSTILKLEPITFANPDLHLGDMIHPLERLIIGLAPRKCTYVYKLTHLHKTKSPLETILGTYVDPHTSILGVEFDSQGQLLTTSIGGYSEYEIPDPRSTAAENALCDALHERRFAIDTDVVKRHAGNLDTAIDFTNVTVVSDYGALIQPYWPGDVCINNLEWYAHLRHILETP